MAEAGDAPRRRAVGRARERWDAIADLVDSELLDLFGRYTTWWLCRFRQVLARAWPRRGSATAPLHRVAVCAVLKYEERFVEEWIAYHRLIGVDHFYLFDNDAAAPLADLLTAHAAYVTVVALPGRSPQKRAYRAFMKRFAAEVEWVAFIDCDEFIHLRRHADIHAFIEEFAAFDSIAVNWLEFGDNGHVDPLRRLSVSAFTRRNGRPARACKSITRAASIRMIKGAHAQYLVPGAVAVNAHKVAIEPARNSHDLLDDGRGEWVTDIASVDHHYLRTRADWRVRMARGRASRRRARFANETEYMARFERASADLNRVEDASLAAWAPRITTYLARLYGLDWRDQLAHHRAEIPVADEEHALHHYLMCRAGLRPSALAHAPSREREES